MSRFRGSLRFHLLAGISSVTLLTWIIVAWSGYYDTRRELDDLLDAHLAQSAEILTTQIRLESEEDDDTLPPPLAHRYQRRLVYQVWDRDWNLLIASADAPDVPLAESQQTGFLDVHTAEKNWRVFSLWRDDQRLLIQVAEQMDGRAYVRNEIIEHLLIPTLSALPVLISLLIYVIHRALKPLQFVAKAIEQRQADNLTAIDMTGVPTELRPVVGQLNALFLRMEDSLQRERRFTGDASHELRTPLAAIRANAQGAQYSVDEGERQNALDRVIAGCDRVTHLIAQLLTLSRIDYQLGIEALATRCDLTSIVLAAMVSLGSSAAKRSISLELACDQPRFVKVNAALMEVLVRNLIDNAIRYSPDDTSVKIDMCTADGQVELTVCDQGPGIPEPLRSRVFERFYRIPTGEQSGSGLGLSIVQRIIELHHGRIDIEAGEHDVGTRISVTLPVAEP